MLPQRPSCPSHIRRLLIQDELHPSVERLFLSVCTGEKRKKWFIRRSPRIHISWSSSRSLMPLLHTLPHLFNYHIRKWPTAHNSRPDIRSTRIKSTYCSQTTLKNVCRNFAAGKASRLLSPGAALLCMRCGISATVEIITAGLQCHSARMNVATVIARY